MGELRVDVEHADGRLRLDALRQSGAFKAFFPRRDPGEAVIVNTAGGITGGDRFRIRARAGQGARLALTTQACERAYRAQPGETGRLTTHLEAEADAWLGWLPQETILYDRSALWRRLDVDLAPGARFLMVEPVIFGRTARGETLKQARFSDRVAIRRSGLPIYLDGVELAGDVAATLSRPATGAGCAAMASLVYAAPDASAHLAPIRARLTSGGGASLLGPDLLVARALGADGYDLRRDLLPILDRLTGGALPLQWRT